MTRDDPAAFAPPPAFGPFRVLHQIGVGALGPVFRTYEPTRDRLVAVKVFRLDITPEQSQALADELSKAADAGLFHPSIVEPIAAGVEGTVAYRAEEYVAAESLDVAIRHYAPAPLEKALPFLTQLAGAIDFARAAGVGHGALHLRDIFVTPDEARASGFGVVEALEVCGLRAPVRRPYSAPERIAGQPWGTPADVFSLGAIAYELLTARRPSGTGDLLGPLSGGNLGEHTVTMRTVLARAMADDPADRYPTALAFASALEAAARGEHVSGAVRAVGAISGAAAAVDSRNNAVVEPAAPAAAIVSAGLGGDGGDLEALNEEVHADVAAEDDEAYDDVGVERDEDAAHYDLSRAEPLEEPEPSLFDDEAAADLALGTAEPERFADEFAVAPIDAPRERDVHDLLRPSAVDDPSSEEDGAEQITAAGAPSIYGHASVTRPDPSYLHQDAAIADPERARPAMLPVAVTGVLCLLVGFAIGYGYANRYREVVAAPQSAGAAAPSTTPPAPAAGAPSEPGKAWSEQSVAQPPLPEPPGIPNEAPPVPAASPGRSGARGSAAATPPRAAASTTGRIIVRSTPAGAAVTINGKWRGRTPLTLDALRFGPYSIRVVQQGYSVGREDFTLGPADPSRTLSFRLQRTAPPAAARPNAGAPAAARPNAAAPRTPPAPAERFAGSVYVDSRPRGAKVLIDGRLAGTTPLSIPDIPIGSHVVRLEMPDYRSWSNTTRVVAGEMARVTGSLERIR